MKKINGYINEYEFVKYLNGKMILELNPMFRNFIDDVFNIPFSYLKIKSWINPERQKSDFFIEINGIIKGFSLKVGIKNSVHVEAISEFIHFLIENGVERQIVIEYLKYHYADGSTNGSGKNRMSISEYKTLNQKEIDKINLSINKKEILDRAVDKFILKGNNSDDYISAVIYGSIDDFVWIKSEDIKELFLSKINLYSTAVHFGPLTCQPKNRCLNYNPIYEKDRFCVQLKWYNLFDDIIENMNNKFINKKY